MLSGALALSGYLTLGAVKTYQMEQMESDLASRAMRVNQALERIYLSAPQDADAEALLAQSAAELLKPITNERALSTTIYLDSGKSYNQLEALSSELLKSVLKGQILYSIHDQGQSPDAYYVDYLAPLYEKETIVGVIELKFFYKQYTLFYENMRRMIFLTGGGVFVFSLLAALLYFGKLTTAIGKLHQSVQQVEAGHFNQIEVLNRSDELGELSAGIGQMAFTIDETLEKLHKEQAHLTLAVGKLKAMETQQRHFFGNITHEFKTPLSVINAYNDLTELYSDDEALQLSTRKQIRDEVLKLTQMVEKTLELAKIEKYDFELTLDTIDLKSLIETCVNRLMVKANKYGLQWRMNLEETVVGGDMEMMTQIVVNLLDNAIKYNHEGGIIWIDLKDKILSIENTGEGVSELVKDKLFEAFAADDSGGQTQETGTGLGLALVKHLVTLQNGHIFIEEGQPHRNSTHLKGCRVVIELSNNRDNLETSSL